MGSATLPSKELQFTMDKCVLRRCGFSKEETDEMSCLEYELTLYMCNKIEQKMANIG